MVLQIAASLEQHSEHPLAKAEELGRELAIPIKFTALPGKGIQVNLSKILYLPGNRRLFSDQNIPLSGEIESLLTEIGQLGQIPVLVGTKQELLGASPFPTVSA